MYINGTSLGNKKTLHKQTPVNPSTSTYHPRAFARSADTISGRHRRWCRPAPRSCTPSSASARPAQWRWHCSASLPLPRCPNGPPRPETLYSKWCDRWSARRAAPIWGRSSSDWWPPRLYYVAGRPELKKTWCTECFFACFRCVVWLLCFVFCGLVWKWWWWWWNWWLVSWFLQNS